MITAS
ncbi:hypothetical protein FGIG_14003, partial [Fasciola gigantica]